MTDKKKFFDYFLIIILFSSSIYFLWLIKLLNDFPWRYIFTDWIINYEGGYIRRGLLGQLSINLSNFLDLNIKYIFFMIHLFIYLLFHFLFFKFFTNFKKNYLFYLFCFSPLVFLYPISTFEAFARKEIFYITFFLLNCYLATKIYNRNLIFFSTNFFVLLSYFIHESSLFFINFFYLSYFVFLKKNNHKIKIFEISFIIMIYFLLPSLLFIPVSEEKIIQMVLLVNENFFEISEFSGAIAWLKSSPFFAFTFLKYNNVDLKYVFQNILFLHFVIVFLYLLFINNFFKYGKYFIIFTFLSFFGPLILFFVWFDWGRLVYIIYNFCLIFTFFCLHNNTDVFHKIDKLTVINNLDYKFKLIFTISYIGLWTPKIFYNDDVVLFPLIILIHDLVKYSIKYGSLLI